MKGFSAGLSRWKTVLLAAFFLATLPALLDAAPATLAEFRNSWEKHHIQTGSLNAVRFIRSYGLNWDPTIIPTMIQDEKKHPRESEVLEMTYSLAIAYMPDRKGCKAEIEKLLRSPDEETRRIAGGFQFDLEEIESGHEKLPTFKD